MSFVRWSNVEKTDGGYEVKFNPRGMGTANSLTIVLKRHPYRKETPYLYCRWTGAGIRDNRDRRRV
jgi:hypothetical protein